MRIFWSEIPLETAQYNRVYSHVLFTLEQAALAPSSSGEPKEKT
jgi:hypothetical protein